MSSLGKILAFINLVLAGLFLGWAIRALNENSDWKVTHDKVKAQLESTVDGLKKDLASANAQKGQLETDKNTLRTAKDTAEADLNRSKEDLAEAKANLNKWSSDLNDLSKTHQSVVDQNNKLQSEKDKAITARNEAEKAKMDAEAKQMAAEKDLGDAKQDIAKKEGSIADLEKEVTSMSKKNKELAADIEQLQAATGASLAMIRNQPKIEGKVLNVAMDGKTCLLSINKGTTDGVQRGFTFDLYDGSKYKGRARVEYVHDGSCSAIMEIPAGGEKPGIGDNATTLL